MISSTQSSNTVFSWSHYTHCYMTHLHSQPLICPIFSLTPRSVLIPSECHCGYGTSCLTSKLESWILDSGAAQRFREFASSSCPRINLLERQSQPWASKCFFKLILGEVTRCWIALGLANGGSIGKSHALTGDKEKATLLESPAYTLWIELQRLTLESLIRQCYCIIGAFV